MTASNDIVDMIETNIWFSDMTHVNYEIIQNFSDINQQNKEGKTLLMYAVITYNTGMVHAILARNDVDIDIQDNKGWTALMYTIRNNDNICSRDIMKKNPNVYLVNNNGEDAIDLARKYTNYTIVIELEKIEPKFKYNFVAEPIVLVV